MPWALALVATWTPAPLRSTSSMTSQPLVSIWSAIVAFFWVSLRAFWISVSKPSALKDLSSAGRSPFSQRLDESASGSSTHARLASPEALSPPPLPPLPPSSLPHAARATRPNAASAAAPAFRDFTIIAEYSRVFGRAVLETFRSSFDCQQRAAPPFACQGSHPV